MTSNTSVSQIRATAIAFSLAAVIPLFFSISIDDTTFSFVPDSKRKLCCRFCTAIGHLSIGALQITEILC